MNDYIVRATAAGSVFADVSFDGGDKDQEFGIIILEKKTGKRIQ